MKRIVEKKWSFNNPACQTKIFAFILFCCMASLSPVLAADEEGRFTYGLDRDALAQSGAQYNDNNLPPPSQNPNLASNAITSDNAPLDPNDPSFNTSVPQDSDLLPHQYPLSDRLTSPDIPTAQLKAAIDAMKKTM